MTEWGKLRINLTRVGFWARNQTRGTSNTENEALTCQTWLLTIASNTWTFWYLRRFRPLWISRLKFYMYFSFPWQLCSNNIYNYNLLHLLTNNVYDVLLPVSASTGHVGECILQNSKSNPITGLYTQRVPGGWGSQISRQSAHEGSNVVSPTRRPPLAPRKYSWYSYLLEAESTSGP
jgi:hypothetical protein